MIRISQRDWQNGLNHQSSDWKSNGLDILIKMFDDDCKNGKQLKNALKSCLSAEQIDKWKTQHLPIFEAERKPYNLFKTAVAINS